MTDDLPTNDPDDYPHTPGILVVPTGEDVDVLRDILEGAYADIKREYETPQTHLPDNPEVRERIERRGSLIQELLAQLRAVEDD
jgi:hypothetical protein